MQTTVPLFEIEESGQQLILLVAVDPRDCDYNGRQHTYNSLMQLLSQLESPQMLIDLSQCRFLDSVTVGIMVGLTLHARRQSGGAALCGADKNLIAMLRRLMLLQPGNKQATWDLFPSAVHAMEQVPWR